MITTYVIKDNKGNSYLSTISKERAEELLEMANDGGCKSMGWRAEEYKIEIRKRPLKRRNEWTF